MIYEMKLRAEPFYAIKSGYKTIELRLYDEKRQALRIGDIIEFSLIDDPEQKIRKIISGLHVSDSFKKLFSVLSILKCGFTPFDIPEQLDSYMNEYYSEDQQVKHKVVGIELEEEPLQRFLVGQTGCMPDCSSYEQALQEISSGLKQTHWMWYVFPQIKGLTSGMITEYYALDISEAMAYIAHPVLSHRLYEICGELLKLPTCDPVSVFGGWVDAYKLRASMTLFASIASENDIFEAVLEKFCMGVRDAETLHILFTQKE